MSSPRRTFLTSSAVAATGVVVAGAVLLGQPALADHSAKARHQVTSRDIKNSTIGTQDLKPLLQERLALAATALQQLPAGSVTRDKLADNAVGSPEVINNSLVASDLAANSVGANEINTGAVGTNQVKDGALTSADVTSLHGVATLTVPVTVPAASCTAAVTANTGKVLDSDLILVSQPVVGLNPLLVVSGRPSAVGSTTISFTICNSTAAAITTGVTSVSVPYAVIDN